MRAANRRQRSVDVGGDDPRSMRSTDAGPGRPLRSRGRAPLPPARARSTAASVVESRRDPSTWSGLGSGAHRRRDPGSGRRRSTSRRASSAYGRTSTRARTSPPDCSSRPAAHSGSMSSGSACLGVRLDDRRLKRPQPGEGGQRRPVARSAQRRRGLVARQRPRCAASPSRAPDTADRVASAVKASRGVQRARGSAAFITAGRSGPAGGR